MQHLKLTISILIVLSASRFIPHPPNFTSLLALSFYVPALLGLRFIPILIISYAITDFIIGYHFGTHWTWGSVFLISLLSQFLRTSLVKRIFGAISGAFIFFLVTNFGVWLGGMYGIDFNGLKTTYIMAIPFFVYSLISTFIFSAVIEAIYKLVLIKQPSLFKK